ncbi:MAG: hypothetical protein J5884_05160 [Paludibacteraceae bacterium]|nr:hypothetical protein [Paludibacteraceae bacterium]
MRKVLTFVAAMCCMVFGFVSSVQAAALADGAVIIIGGTTVDTENKGNVENGIISSGKVSYDDSKSILTLNNVKISGNDTYGVISIDASSVSNDLTIQVVGECYVKGSRIAPLHVKGMSSGHKVIITGDKSATLKLEAYGSADVSALLCAKSQTSTSASEFFPLQVKGGMQLILDNFQAGDTDDKPALMCHHYVFDQINYSFKSWNAASDAIYTATSDPTDNEHNNVQQIYYDATVPTEVYGYAFTKEYPVYVAGMQMTDGKPELGSSDINIIQWGSISYDDAKSTLTIDGAKIQPESGTEVLRIADADPSKKIKIVVANSYSTLASSTSGIKGLVLENPVEIDPQNILDIDVVDDALYFTKDLTIKSTMSGWMDVVSASAKGIVGSGSNKLTINSTIVYAKGNEESFSNFELNLVNAEMDKYTWDATEKSAMDGTNKVKGKQVTIKQTSWKYTATAKPAAGGTIALQWKETAEGTFADVSNPYTHEGKGYMKLQATANTGYEFVKWEGIIDMEHEYDNPYTPTAELFGDNYTVQALFAKQTSVDATKISVLNSNDFYTYNEKFKGTKEYGESVPLEANEYLYDAIYANGKIYFSVYNNVTYKSAIFSAEFKDGALEARKAVLDFTADDSPISTLAYNSSDNCIYAISNEMSGQVLLKVPTDGNPMSKVNNLASPVNVAATAFNSSNVLYLLEAGTPGKLYTMSLSDASLTEIGEMTGLNIMGDCSMLFTPEGELIAQLESSPDPAVYLINPSTAAYDWLASNFIYSKGMFYNLPPAAPKTSITIKSADESKGTVDPAGVKKVKQGSTLTFKATAKTFYVFSEWKEDGNKDNPRTITVGASDQTFTAVFVDDPNMKIYPIKIGNVVLMTGATSIVYPNTDFPALKAGMINYDPASNTLTLDNAEIETSGSVRALTIDNGSSKGGALTIEVKGASKLTAAAGAMLLREFSSVTFVAGDASAKLTLKGTQGIEVSSADLVISGLAMDVQGSTSGIVGTGEEKATVKGAALEIGAATAGAFYNFSSIETEYCSVDGTHEIKDGQVNKGSSKATDKVTFKAWPKLTVKAAVGKGDFTLESMDKNPGTKFTNEGWFESGDKIQITAKAAKDFVFYRWMDDTKWKNDEERWDANRKRPSSENPDLYAKTSSDQEVQAVFYYKPKSNKSWYGVSAKENKVVQFTIADFGTEVIKATKPTANNIKAGDFVEKSWWYLDGTALKGLPITSGFEDGADLTDGKDIEELATGCPSAITDMTYDLIGKGQNKYAVGGKKLYQFNASENKFDEVGTFKDKDDNDVAAVAIAADSKGKLYILSPGTPGRLYTVGTTKDEKVSVAIVGAETNAGSIDIKVESDKQSIAFDHVTGELFWGAADYMRIIDMNEMKTYAVADLGKTGGAQGFIKSLHKMDKTVKIYAEVNEKQEAFGTVSIKGTGLNNRFIYDTEVTISATPNEGYEFVRWMQDEDEESKEAEYSFKARRNGTYTAYFQEATGIEEIQIDNVPCTKILLDGQLYIIREGRVYNASGVRVK